MNPVRHYAPSPPTAQQKDRCYTMNHKQLKEKALDNELLRKEYAEAVNCHLEIKLVY